MKMNSTTIFQLTTTITPIPEYMYISYIKIQTKQKKDENTLKYVSGAKDQEG